MHKRKVLEWLLDINYGRMIGVYSDDFGFENLIDDIGNDTDT